MSGMSTSVLEYLQHIRDEARFLDRVTTNIGACKLDWAAPTLFTGAR